MSGTDTGGGKNCPCGLSAAGTPGASVEKDPKYPPVVSCTLRNGLQLLILRKTFVPTVSFTMIFKVGNVDSPPGKTGLAHLFEHMAFKGTRTVNSLCFEKEKPALDRVDAAALSVIEEESRPEPDAEKLAALRAGLEAAEQAADKLAVKDEYWKIYTELGESGMNAMTSTDYTAYVVSLPSNRLEAWMLLESDRFMNPVLREFYRERDVVMEERLMGESDPNRLLWETLSTTAFSVHPYHNPIIGWEEDLRRLTRGDAEKFYRTFYAPNNAVLSVVGDVEPGEVIRLAEKYFSPWKSRPLPERDYPAEPPQTAEKRVEVRFGAKPALRIGFHNPGYSGKDAYALIMLSEILSGGKSSRFYRGIVEGRELALYANSYSSFPGDLYPSLFVVMAAPKAPHTLEEVEAAVLEELDRLKTEPPSRREMEKVLNGYEADLVGQLESGAGLGMSLAVGQQMHGDWRFDWKAADELRRLEPADISRAAAKYFTRENRTTVFLRENGTPPLSAI